MHGDRVQRANTEGQWPGREVGADARNRTADPFITSEVLCQLSYVGLGSSLGILGHPDVGAKRPFAPGGAVTPHATFSCRAMERPSLHWRRISSTTREDHEEGTSRTDRRGSSPWRRPSWRSRASLLRSRARRRRTATAPRSRSRRRQDRHGGQTVQIVGAEAAVPQHDVKATLQYKKSTAKAWKNGASASLDGSGGYALNWKAPSAKGKYKVRVRVVHSSASNTSAAKTVSVK